MSHVVLLGDSVFDNKVYVAPEPDVIEHLRDRLGPGEAATLLAVDGHVTDDVPRLQVPRIPRDATHMIVSVGGNDALGCSGLLQEPAGSVGEAVHRLGQLRDDFATRYRRMVDVLAARRLPTALCTIYDTAYPEPYRSMVISALSLFNDVIVRAAVARHWPLIDLRQVCAEPADFANPIEPSSHGAAKIASVIREFVASGDLSRRTTVWT